MNPVAHMAGLVTALNRLFDLLTQILGTLPPAVVLSVVVVVVLGLPVVVATTAKNLAAFFVRQKPAQRRDLIRLVEALRRRHPQD